MNQKRPVNLDLTTIKMPIMAIVSIFHRLSGILLFLLMPFVIYCLALSLKNTSTFTDLQEMLSSLQYKFVVWLFFSSLGYHIIAGFRHLIMDAGFGEELHVARNSSRIVFALGILQALVLGIWLW